MAEHLTINDVAPRIQYVADGVQAAFSFPFAIFQPPDLQVHLDAEVQTGGYTVSGAGVATGGAVVFAVPPAAGVRVTIRRQLTLQRTTDFQADGIIRAKTLNDELDYQTAALQQLAEEIGRAVRRSPVSPAPGELELPEPQAGCALKWNAAGTGLVNSAFDPDAPGDASAARAEAVAARDEAVAARDLAQAVAGGVRVTAADGAAAPLSVKLAAGAGIALAVGGDPADQRLTIAATGSQAVLDRLALLEANLALNTLRDQIDAGWSVLKMVDGVADEFNDALGIAAMTGASYVPAGRYVVSTTYGPDLTTGGAALSGGTWDGFSPSNAFDKATDSDTPTALQWYSSQVGSAVTNAAWIGYDFGGARDIRRIRSWQSDLPASYKVQYSDNGSTWVDAVTGLVPVSGWNQVDFASVGAHRYWRLMATGAVANNYQWGIHEILMMDFVVAVQTTTESVSFTASAFTNANPPAEARLVLLHQPVDTVTLNADCTIEASRDGGTTWTAGTLVHEGAFDATAGILTAVVDLSAQPAGTAMCWRFRTYNQKSQRLHGVWMQWR